MVSKERIQVCNTAPVNPRGRYVLYWMIAFRRARWNFSLERAIEYAVELKKPLVVLEALRCNYKWASDRFHCFIIDGMRDNASAFEGKPVYYYPYLEPRSGTGSGMLADLAKHAAVVVTDDFPCFFLPHIVEVIAKHLPIKIEKVDSNGILPMRAGEKIYSRAVDFRKFLQHNLPFYLTESIKEDPFEGQMLPKLETLPGNIEKRWPKATQDNLREDASKYPIDHSVAAVNYSGGSGTAQKKMLHFIKNLLPDYAENRNAPENNIASGLSPYLHFGHISSHQVFYEIKKMESWSINKLSPRGNGSRHGWWGMSKPTEAFLDQIITWRELGYNMCWQNENYDTYDSLPVWAQKTLEEHAIDPREYIYELEDFEQAKTHDPLWNAAQNQLVSEGIIHNYLRMLWGKKILEWTPHPRIALDIMLELNNKYAVDGRNPNSYSGIFWVLGRYDRAWGPERPIFGKIRYMTSENTARKYKVDGYIKKYNSSQ